MREAAARGVPVSFDVNYRSRLWGPEAARDFFAEILPALRYLFVGADDAETVFGLSGAPEAVLSGLRGLAPRATIAVTLGEAGSVVLAEVRRAPVEALPVTVVDRWERGRVYRRLRATLAGRSFRGGGCGDGTAALKCTIGATSRW